MSSENILGKAIGMAITVMLFILSGTLGASIFDTGMGGNTSFNGWLGMILFFMPAITWGIAMFIALFIFKVRPSIRLYLLLLVSPAIYYAAIIVLGFTSRVFNNTDVGMSLFSAACTGFTGAILLSLYFMLFGLKPRYFYLPSIAGILGGISFLNPFSTDVMHANIFIPYTIWHVLVGLTLLLGLDLSGAIKWDKLVFTPE